MLSGAVLPHKHHAVFCSMASPPAHCPGLTSGSAVFSLADLGNVCLPEHLCGDLRFRFHQNKYCSGPPLPVSRGYHEPKQTRRALRACPGSPKETALPGPLPECRTQVLGPRPAATLCAGVPPPQCDSDLGKSGHFSKAKWPLKRRFDL